MQTGENYDPELGKQIELGIKYQSVDGTQFLTTSLFHITKSNVLAADPSNFLQKTQIGEVVSQGIEIEGKWYATDNLDFSASYTYLDMEVTDAGADKDLKGTTPIYVPKHSANLWTNYHFFDGSLAGTRLSGGYVMSEVWNVMLGIQLVKYPLTHSSIYHWVMI